MRYNPSRNYPNAKALSIEPVLWQPPNSEKPFDPVQAGTELAAALGEVSIVRNEAGERITTVISARMDGTTCEHITIETRSIGT